MQYGEALFITQLKLSPTPIFSLQAKTCVGNYENMGWRLSTVMSGNLHLFCGAKWFIILVSGMKWVKTFWVQNVHPNM